MTVRKAIEREKERAGDGVNGRNEGWREGRRQMMPCGGRQRGREIAASRISCHVALCLINSGESQVQVGVI